MDSVATLLIEATNTNTYDHIQLYHFIKFLPKVFVSGVSVTVLHSI